MLMIRLQRIGRKKSPSYRLVLAEKTRDTQGKATEILGSYNPVLTTKPLVIKKERIEYWLSKGAQASPTVHNLLVKEGIASGAKQKSVSISKKRQAKIVEKVAAAKAEQEEKVKAVKAEKAAEAAAATEPEEQAKAGTPAEEKKEENA